MHFIRCLSSDRWEYSFLLWSCHGSAINSWVNNAITMHTNSMAEKIILPGDLFQLHIANENETGNKIKSDRRKKSGRVVIFEDGGKLMLHKSGHMSHKYASGKIVQCSPIGKRLTVCPSSVKMLN